MWDSVLNCWLFESSLENGIYNNFAYNYLMYVWNLHRSPKHALCCCNMLSCTMTFISSDINVILCIHESWSITVSFYSFSSWLYLSFIYFILFFFFFWCYSDCRWHWNYSDASGYWGYFEEPRWHNSGRLWVCLLIPSIFYML